jgi:hypothetical protein
LSGLLETCFRGLLFLIENGFEKNDMILMNQSFSFSNVNKTYRPSIDLLLPYGFHANTTMVCNIGRQCNVLLVYLINQ